MAEVVLFHHAQGLTLGVVAFADEQTRRGARGALLFHGCLPVTAVNERWPNGVPVQIHAMEDDPWMEEDTAAARDLAAAMPNAEFFVYPGDKHLFADASLPDYDERAARLLTHRVLTFLDAVA